MSVEAQQKITEQLKPLSYQQVFFTAIAYDSFVHGNAQKIELSEFIKQKFCLVTGIAAPKPLVDFLNIKQADFTHNNYPDHDVFSNNDINEIAKNDIILTTQKDYMRLQNEKTLMGKLYYLPISVQFLNNETAFKEQLYDFTRSNNY